MNEYCTPSHVKKHSRFENHLFVTISVVSSSSLVDHYDPIRVGNRNFNLPTVHNIIAYSDGIYIWTLHFCIIHHLAIIRSGI
jgi:hypothetical protein